MTKNKKIKRINEDENSRRIERLTNAQNETKENSKFIGYVDTGTPLLRVLPVLLVLSHKRKSFDNKLIMEE